MSSIKVMRLRYAGTCACGEPIAAGQIGGWDREARAVKCMSCVNGDPPVEVSTPEIATPTVGSPGDSLSRTYAARSNRREERMRASFPRLGRVLLAVTPEPPSTRAFKIGAEGERKAAERVLGRAGLSASFLLNRKLGRGRSDGDIDMIAICSVGVMVIDVKHYRDAKVEVRRSGLPWHEKEERLFISGRDRTKLLESLTRQRDAVRSALARDTECADVPVSSVLCFVGAEIPLFASLSVGGVRIFGSRQLGRFLRKASGTLDQARREAIWTHLAAELPPA